MTSRSATSSDLDMYYAISLGGDTRLRRRVKLWVMSRELHCVMAYRFGRWSNRVKSQSPVRGTLPMVLYRVWSRWNSTVHHVEIALDADIGPGFLLMHRYNVLIGPCAIGANVVVHHNVTIGERVAGGDNDLPVLGSRVWIGPGVTIAGAAQIGDGVTLSAGTVLTKSVPSASLVAGNPGRVVRMDYDNSAMINYGSAPGA